jgi:hypothetical protein
MSLVSNWYLISLACLTMFLCRLLWFSVFPYPFHFLPRLDIAQTHLNKGLLWFLKNLCKCRRVWLNYGQLHASFFFLLLACQLEHRATMTWENNHTCLDASVQRVAAIFVSSLHSQHDPSNVFSWLCLEQGLFYLESQSQLHKMECSAKL